MVSAPPHPHGHFPEIQLLPHAHYDGGYGYAMSPVGSAHNHTLPPRQPPPLGGGHAHPPHAPPHQGSHHDLADYGLHSPPGGPDENDFFDDNEEDDLDEELTDSQLEEEAEMNVAADAAAAAAAAAGGGGGADSMGGLHSPHPAMMSLSR